MIWTGFLESDIAVRNHITSSQILINTERKLMRIKDFLVTFAIIKELVMVDFKDTKIPCIWGWSLTVMIVNIKQVLKLI